MLPVDECQNLNSAPTKVGCKLLMSSSASSEARKDDENSSDVAAESPAPDGIAGSLSGTVVLGVRAFHTQLLAIDSQYFAWLQDFAGHRAHAGVSNTVAN